MNILYMDTAMNACCVAVYNAAQDQVTVREEHRVRGQAERLMPLVAEAMQDAALTPQDLNAIAVTVGPGTFTGLRVGMAAAKAMALALQVPIVPLTTLELLLQQAAADSDAAPYGIHMAVIETKRSDYYVQAVDVKTGHLMQPAASMTAEQIAQIGRDEKVWLIGDALMRLESEIAFHRNWHANPVTCPDPHKAIFFAQKKCHAHNCFSNKDISPLYLREADVSAPKSRRFIEQ